MNNPTKVRIEDREYPINTDFRVALECNRIATDTSIGDTERALGIIYTLYGEKGLNGHSDYNKLLELAQKYLCCNKELENNNKEPDMDYEQDKGYIQSSFKQDYQYNPYNLEYFHWWDFYNDLSNLSNNEFGTCCILNRVRNLRTMDLSTIKDIKEREKVKKAQEQVALKKKQKEYTKQERDSIDRFYELTGLNKNI